MADTADTWWTGAAEGIEYDFGPSEWRCEIRMPMMVRLKLLWRRFRKRDRQPTRVIVEASSYSDDLAEGQEPPEDSWFSVYDGPPGNGVFKAPVESRYWRATSR